MWNHVVTKRFLKVATLYLDGSFAPSWHSLNQLHEVGEEDSPNW